MTTENKNEPQVRMFAIAGLVEGVWGRKVLNFVYWGPDLIRKGVLELFLEDIRNTKFGHGALLEDSVEIIEIPVDKLKQDLLSVATDKPQPLKVPNDDKKAEPDNA